MKLAFFDDFKLGVVAGDKVVDVTDVVKDIPRLGPQDVMRGVIERFDTLKDSRQEFGGLKTEQVKRLKDLELENSRLRKAVSDLTLDKLILQEGRPGKRTNKKPT